MKGYYGLIAKVVLLCSVLSACGGGGGGSTGSSTTQPPAANEPPSVVVGTQTTSLEPGETVVLSAQVSDDDGQVVSVHWVQIEGPAVSIDNPDSATISFTAPRVAEDSTLVFIVSATDNSGATRSQNVAIEIISTNVLPEIVLEQNKLVEEGSEVTLTAVASDPDGEISALLWTQTEGPDVTIENDQSLSATFVAPQVDESTTLVFRLTATDDLGASQFKEISVEVSDHNNPPVIAVSGTGEVLPGNEYELSGQVSDADGSVASVLWEQILGPEVAIKAPDSVVTSFIAPQVTHDTTLIFRLSATDDKGAGSSVETSVVVTYVNKPPVVDITASSSVESGKTGTLSAQTNDSDGQVVAVKWTQLEGPAAHIASPQSASTSFTAPAVTADSLLVFRLSATDDKGAVAFQDASVTVFYVNKPPLVEVSQGLQANSGEQVQLTGSVSDSDGLVASTLWTQLEGPAVSLADSSAVNTTFTAPEVDEDTQLVFRLTATDDKGATASQNTSVQVHHVNQPPVVAVSDTITVESEAQVQLKATATDSDGQISSVLWDQIQGPTVSIADAQSLNASFTAPKVNEDTTLMFRFTATDDKGSSASSDQTVVVKYVNKPPVIEMGQYGQYESGETVILSAAVSDSDGEVISSLWTQTAGPSVSIASPQDLSTSFVAPDVSDDSTVTLNLTVKDDKGAERSADVSISIVKKNLPPEVTVDAGTKVVPGSLVNLSGTASDSDGQIVTTVWTQIEGPLVTMNASDTLNMSFTAPSVAQDSNLVFRLTATDDKGKSGYQEVTVVVVNTTPPVISTSGSLSVEQNKLFYLSATATDDGRIVKSGWRQLSGPTVELYEPITTWFSQNVEYIVAPKVYQDAEMVFEFWATDDKGITATATKKVQVLAAYTPVVSAGPSKAAAFGETVTLEGGAYDQNGDTLTVQWQQKDGAEVTLSDTASLTPSFTMPAVVSGHRMRFQLTVSDGTGRSSSSNVTIYADLSGAVNLPNPSLVGIVDYNGDGAPDLYSSDATHVYVAVNAGNGTYGNPQVIYQQPLENMLKFAGWQDIDGDGDQDLLLVTLRDVYWKEQLDDHTFADAHEMSVGWQVAMPHCLPDSSGLGEWAFEDIDKDGIKDMFWDADCVSWGANAGHSSYFAKGLPGHKFTQPQIVTMYEVSGMTELPYPVNVDILDLDGDGAKEYVVTTKTRSSFEPLDSQSAVVFGYQKGLLTKLFDMSGFNVSAYPQYNKWLDVDFDGLPDWLTYMVDPVQSVKKPSVRLNQGGMNFADTTVLDSSMDFSRQVDLDNDGLVDLVREDGTAHKVYWRKRGAGGYAAEALLIDASSLVPNSVLSPSTVSFDAVDVDKDGDTDYVLKSSYGPILTYLNDGNGVFSAL